MLSETPNMFRARAVAVPAAGDDKTAKVLSSICSLLHQNEEATIKYLARQDASAGCFYLIILPNTQLFDKDAMDIGEEFHLIRPILI